MVKRGKENLFKRGFKAEAERISAQAREDLDLAHHEPLCPVNFAQSLSVILLNLQEIPVKKEVLDYLLSSGRSEWFAFTLTFDSKVVIVRNPTHSKARQSSDLMHELAHIICGHEPSKIVHNPGVGIPCREHDEQSEAEAGWLGGCLLLPRVALLHQRKEGMNDSEIMDLYSVSGDLLRYRRNVTGLDKIRRRQ